MIIVAVEIGVKKGTAEEVRDALRVMEHETQKEVGCITFVFTVDVNDPTRIRIFERWETIEHLAAHFKMPHMAPFREVLSRIKQSMDVKVYDIAGEIKLPA